MGKVKRVLHTDVYANCSCLIFIKKKKSKSMKGITASTISDSHKAPDNSDGIINPLVFFQTLCCGYLLESSCQDDSNEFP